MVSLRPDFMSVFSCTDRSSGWERLTEAVTDKTALKPYLANQLPLFVDHQSLDTVNIVVAAAECETAMLRAGPSYQRVAGWGPKLATCSGL